MKEHGRDLAPTPTVHETLLHPWRWRNSWQRPFHTIVAIRNCGHGSKGWIPNNDPIVFVFLVLFDCHRPGLWTDLTLNRRRMLHFTTSISVLTKFKITFFFKDYYRKYFAKVLQASSFKSVVLELNKWSIWPPLQNWRTVYYVKHCLMTKISHTIKYQFLLD